MQAVTGNWILNLEAQTITQLLNDPHCIWPLTTRKIGSKLINDGLLESWTSMADRRVRIFVTGKVQGVFFRQALKVMAKKNDILGWVRNLKDGRVEAVLEGNEDGLDRIIEWAHGGPANARVEDVEIRNEEPLGEFTTFDVRY